MFLKVETNARNRKFLLALGLFKVNCFVEPSLENLYGDPEKYDIQHNFIPQIQDGRLFWQQPMNFKATYQKFKNVQILQQYR